MFEGFTLITDKKELEMLNKEINDLFPFENYSLEVFYLENDISIIEEKLNKLLQFRHLSKNDVLYFKEMLKDDFELANEIIEEIYKRHFKKELS